MWAEEGRKRAETAIVAVGRLHMTEQWAILSYAKRRSSNFQVGTITTQFTSRTRCTEIARISVSRELVDGAFAELARAFGNIAGYFCFCDEGEVRKRRSCVRCFRDVKEPQMVSITS